MPDHGLTQHQLNIIKGILRPFAQDIDRVGLFGSRAKGTQRQNSDVDMVIYGTLSGDDADRLWTLFDASELPIKVDLVVYHLITHPLLREHIDSVIQPLFLKQELLEK